MEDDVAIGVDGERVAGRPQLLDRSKRHHLPGGHIRPHHSQDCLVGLQGKYGTTPLCICTVMLYLYMSFYSNYIYLYSDLVYPDILVPFKMSSVYET